MTGLTVDQRAGLAHAAREIATAAREVPLRHFRRGFAVEAKADESPVTVADRETEAAIRAEIGRRYPGHGILGEEFGRAGLDAEFVWVVDPIDGTKSFISGHPMWGTLLGLLHMGEPVAGLVGMPALGELAWGGPGLGAWLAQDGAEAPTALHVREGVEPGAAFVAINEAPRILAAQPAALGALLAEGRYQRATADCYSYVQLAAGWIDGVVDYGLEPFDYLPVLPLVEAAGGVMTDWEGRPLRIGSDGRVVAGSPAVHARLVEVLAPFA
ncbi:inositol monophosphatase [Limibaculum sp. FT325]|uniref:inositol monophosphatase family protein n=1 Tax=Thermohalobaculum sediminis TaxID=2939436 RepID=UPI0020C094F8|nr:inositol monophosphatase family protein [Limibaculum sediminis]MCL5776941.1 inositol monophosphatase [Limibaculum sediminis]